MSPRIAVVCLGNICRSPIGSVVLQAEARRRGIDLEVTSAGTAGDHVGKPMDRRSAQVLTAHGYDPSLHRAQRFDVAWFENHDLILAMDGDNLADLRALTSNPEHRNRVRLFRDFDPEGGGEVPDPYYDDLDAFEFVFAQVARCVPELLDQVEHLGQPSSGSVVAP